MTQAFGDLRRPESLVAMLGGFWASEYAGAGSVVRLHTATCGASEQLVIDLARVIASLSRFTVPVWRRENWSVLELDPTQLTGVPQQFGEGPFTFDPNQSQFGALEGVSVRYPARGLCDAGAIVDRILSPRVVLTRGIDFTIDGEWIVFRENPYKDGRFSTVVSKDGQEHPVLWIWRGAYDYRDIATQFGYVIGLQLASSQGYRDLVNAIFDALVQGSSRASLEFLFSAATGARLAQSRTTVTDVARDRHGLLVITEDDVYRYGRGASPLVAAGDSVVPGQPLADTFSLHPLQPGAMPGDLQELTLGAGFFPPNLGIEELGFPNQVVPLSVRTYLGKTRLEFPLKGRPQDVSSFFDELHRRGIDQDLSLANLLDVRQQPLDEPSAASLPTTINPLQFLVRNQLRGHAILGRIQVGSFGPDSLGFGFLSQARRILPPRSALLLVAQLPELSDSAMLDGEDGPSGRFAGNTLIAESDVIPGQDAPDRGHPNGGCRAT
jgi:hypothetical protein